MKGKSVMKELCSRKRGDGIIYYRPGTCDEIILGDPYWDHRALSDGRGMLNANAVVLDIGAHIGAYALAIAPFVPLGVVHAIEPESENFDVLKKNIDSNRHRNIRAHRVALAATNGSSRFYISDESWGHSLTTSTPEWVDVKTCTLDAFLAENDLRVDYMKMNIEGGEYAVLMQTPADALRRIRRMTVEFHPHVEYTHQDLCALLSAAGYQSTFEMDQGTKGKGWISAELKS